MATVQEPKLAGKHDAFLELQLNRARQRVRSADVLLGLLGFLSLTAGYGLAMILLDRWLELPAIVRQIALCGWIIGSAVYLYRVLVRPALASVNPYYAARLVERTIPDVKNSLVNWLDLRDQRLAPSIRAAVSGRAADDLSHADLDEAVRDHRLSAWSIVAGVLFVGVIVAILAFRPTQFFSLMSRTFAPFSKTAIAAQTEIKLLDPANGDVIIPIHQAIDFRVELSGRIPKVDEPDAARLKLRYTNEDPNWEELRLEGSDRSSEWSIRVPSNQVRNGFEYQIIAGDAATPIHRVQVRAKALVTDFEVRYHYRPYLRYADDLRNDPNLQAVRGTEVTILARTNRVVKDGVLRFTAIGADKPQIVEARLSTERPDTLQFQLTLDSEGQYRLQFVASDGERSDETLPYEVRVLPDQPPQVEINQQAPEKMAINGTLSIGGRATDDYGLTSARLLLKLKPTPDGLIERLPPVIHRAGKPWKLPDGSDPRSLELKEVVALDKLTDEGGKPIALHAGMQIIYQYEAEDNCDNPKPQVGQSKEHTVTLEEPQAQEQRDDQRNQAMKDKEQHDKQQEQERNNQGNQGNDNKQPDEGKPNEGGDESQPMNPDDQKTLDQAKRIADEVQKQDGNQQDKGNTGKANPDTGNSPDNQSPQINQPNEQAKTNSDQKSKSGGQDKGQPNEQSKGQSEQNKANAQQQPDNNNSGEKSADQNSKSNGQEKGQPNEQSKGQSEQNKASAQQQRDNNKPGEKTGDQNTKPDGQEKGQPKEQSKDQSHQSKANPQQQPDNNKSGEKSGDQTPAGQKPDPMNSNEQHKSNNQSGGADKQESKPEQTKPGAKGQESPEQKSSDKSDKTGNKQRTGPKQDNPSDQQPKTSPDQGKASGGEPGSQRADKNPNANEKSDKPTEVAKSGHSDEKAAKPDGDKPKGANGENKADQKPGDKAKAEAGKAKSEPKSGASEKSDTAHEKADKPHEQPGDKPNSEPKSEGTKAPSSKSGDQQKDSGPKPPDVQKLIDQFKKADPETQKKIIEKLQEMAKNSPTPQERKAADEACKECQGNGDGQSKSTAQPKGADKSAGKSSNEKAGGKGDDKGQKTDGEKPGAKQSSKPGDVGSQPNAEHKLEEKGQPKDKNSPNEKGRPGEKGENKNSNKKSTEPVEQKQSGNQPDAPRGQRTGDADVNSTPAGPGNEPNEKYLREAGELQLETFKKKVDRKVLEQLKMTEEEYEKFLRAYQDLITRSKDMPKTEPNDKVRGGNQGGSAANQKAKKADSGPKTGPKTDRGGRGAAPPEFRDQYKEFTEEQSKSKSGKP